MFNSIGRKVSIIIPAHNAERYIADCIESVLKQSYEDWELIIVDDGSKDQTAEICSCYAGKDNRIRLFHNDTGKGVSSARNRGLDEATGDYIVFLDSDDLLPSDSVLLRMNYMEEVDLVCGNNDEIDEDGRFLKKGLTRSVDSVLNNKDAVRIITVFNKQGYQGYCWNKLFKWEIIEKEHIRFHEEISYNEDRLFCYQYVTYCQKVKMIPEVVYHYRQIQGSAMNNLHDLGKTDELKIISEFRAFDIILDSVKEQYPDTYYLLCADAQNKAITAWKLYRRDANLGSEMKKQIKRYGKLALEAPAEIMPMTWKFKTVCRSSVKRLLFMSPFSRQFAAKAK